MSAERARAGLKEQEIVTERLTSVRERQAADIDQCAQALAMVQETSGYPTNWQADPALWLTPPGLIRAWIAVTNELPVAGHVIVRQVPDSRRTAELSRLFVVPASRRQGVARALCQTVLDWAALNDMDLVLEVTDHLRAAQTLYERIGFTQVSTEQADWQAPDGQPVTLHRYAWTGNA